MKHSGSGGNGSRVSVMRLTINHKPEEAEIIVAKKEEKKSGKVNVELWRFAQGLLVTRARTSLFQVHHVPFLGTFFNVEIPHSFTFHYLLRLPLRLLTRQG